MRRRAQFLSAAIATVAGCTSRSSTTAQRPAPIVIDAPRASSDSKPQPNEADVPPPAREKRDPEPVAEPEGSPASDEECRAAGVTSPCRKLVRISSCLIYVLQMIQFAQKSAKPLSDSADVLDATAETLKHMPDVRIRIEGHTDDAEPKKLGLSRAEAVRAELVSRGIDAGRMTAVNMGKSNPLVSGRSAEARARNRRVEFKIEP